MRGVYIYNRMEAIVLVLNICFVFFLNLEFGPHFAIMNHHTLEDELNVLVELSQKKLLNILMRIIGHKDLVIDPKIMKPLEKIVGASKLKSHGVDKIYKLETSEIPFTNSQRVFLINADLLTMKRVCDKINAEVLKNDGTYHVILVSRKLKSLVKLMEEEGVYGYITLHPFQWELIPLDNRILSMEYDNFYKNLFVEGDQSYLPCLARSIWTLHQVFGKPSLTLVQGKFSQHVYRMVEILHDELGASDRVKADMSCFLIVDRDIDFASVLLTGATYTSLLDEEFGIKSGMVDVKTDGGSSLGECYLSSTKDPIYAQIKNKHFSAVFPLLRAKAKELNEVRQQTKNLEIHEMKSFIAQKLPTVTLETKSLAYHISACEALIGRMGPRFEALQEAEVNILQGLNRKDVINFIEQSLATNSCNRYAILRLICLLSLASDGLYHDEISRLKMQYLHIYGYQHLTLFHNLEKAGLCTEQPSLMTDLKGGAHLAKVVQAMPARRSIFYANACKNKLFPNTSDDYDLKNPKDLGFTFGGSYTPLVCQLVKHLTSNDSNFDDVIKNTNCTIYGEKPNTSLRSFLVYFVGGVTYAEISAFQLLEKLTGSQIIIAGSSIINGNTLMKSYF